jgi:AraC family transcriptional regulator of adaptative response / DNA-3-methyladenine glycosylase II
VTLDPRRCYRAILARDVRFDGRFFTAVRTTGIYCRPVCPVRPPKLENMIFVPCAAAAEAMGYRPCMRCRPETAPGTPAWMGSSAVVTRALRLIDEDALDGDDVEAFAQRLGIGGRQLRRLFARHLGASPGEVARVRRVHFARALIDETDLPMTQVALSAGFRSIRQFNHAVRATFRTSPTVLRRRRTRETTDGALLVRLPYRPPYAWDDMLGFLAARAVPGVEHVTAGVYTRVITLGDDAGTVAISDPGRGSWLEMRVTLPASAGLIRIVERARRLFDLAADPHEIARHLRRSPRLKGLVATRPGLRVPGAWDPFELAIRAILGQQVTVRGATTLTGRLVTAFGLPFETGLAGLTHVFPAPATLVDADVERIGIPGARASTIRALSRAVADGTLVLDATEDLEATEARLTAVPGIGPWTASYIAMRAFGEPDAFPAGDLGVRRALGNGAGPLSERAVREVADAWRPWRAYALLHLWNEETHR